MAETKPIDRVRRGRFIRYTPLVLWIAVVLFLSSSAGSMSRTSRIIRPLLEFVFPGASEATLVLYHGYVRKFAHFAEYAVLAYLASRAFWGSAKYVLLKHWYAAAFIAAVLVSASDEFYQSFNPQRTGTASDVALDLGGALTAIILLVFFRTRTKNC